MARAARAGDAPAGAADDDHDLALVVELVALRGPHEILAVADQRLGEAHEHARAVGGGLAVAVLGVAAAVVDADAEDLPRPGNGPLVGDVGQPVVGLGGRDQAASVAEPILGQQVAEVARTPSRRPPRSTMRSPSTTAPNEARPWEE